MAARRPLRRLLLPVVLLQRAWLPGSGPDFAWAQSAEARCWLASLQLRSGDDPVDVVPAFSPGHFDYAATLASASASYAVDAHAQSGCEVDSVPNQDVPVQPGGSSVLTIFAKDPSTSVRQAYVLTVYRSLGTETKVQAISIEGGTFTPSFVPEITSYAVALDLGYETIKVVYKLQDVGQKIRIEAFPQVPAGSPMSTTAAAQSQSTSSPTTSTTTTTPGGANGTNASSGRRLSGSVASGEIQYLERAKSFLIDVGSSRRVAVTLESADNMQALRGVYTLDVTRAGCDSARPLYSPATQTCTVNCPSSTYAMPSAQRCAKCNTNCAVCSDLLTCILCFEDTVQQRYIVQADGSCRQEVVAIESKYKWWVIGFAMFLGLLLCIALALLGECICGYCCGLGCCWDWRRADGAAVYFPESDSDGDLKPNGRRRRRWF